jgi:Domain of unknown function (DUF4202)
VCVTQSQSLTAAIAAVDEANGLDPNSVLFAGAESPLAQVQGARASIWLDRLASNPPDAVVLAVRAHHLRRWTVDRSSYPEGRAGYHRWKRAAKEVHASALAEVVVECGVESEVLERAQELVQRIGLGTDPETQLIEDCACLVFLETQYESLIAKIGRDKVVDAVRKTVKKMSPDAIALAGEAIGTDLGRSVLAEATTG